MFSFISLAVAVTPVFASYSTPSPSQKQNILTIPDLSSCASTPSVYTCENTTAIANTCCTSAPGGLVLQTQFWSTWTGLEGKGQKLPKNSWTIHGLWPDFCDGSYTQYCDLSRQYDPSPAPNTTNGKPDGTPVPPWKGPGVDKFINDFGRKELLEYMNNYWINQAFPNNDLWAHEFSKHGTCMSSFDTKCFGKNYKEGSDVVNYFDATVRAFAMYPTFSFLAASSILPSNTTTYTLSQLETAIKSQTGAVPYLGCSGPAAPEADGKTILTEIWYFSHVLGTPQYGHYKTLDSLSKSSCTKTGQIHYYERGARSEKLVT